MFTSAIEANFAYCEARQGHVQQQTAESVQGIIKQREENIRQLGIALSRYKEPVLKKIQLLQLELGKKENQAPKKQEELNKQLQNLNTELENAGKDETGQYKRGIQKLINYDKRLSSTATELIGRSGQYKESLEGDHRATNNLFSDTLKYGNQPYNDNGKWFSPFSMMPSFLPSPILRAIKMADPFSAN